VQLPVPGLHRRIWLSDPSRRGQWRPRGSLRRPLCWIGICPVLRIWMRTPSGRSGNVWSSPYLNVRSVERTGTEVAVEPRGRVTLVSLALLPALARASHSESDAAPLAQPWQGSTQAPTSLFHGRRRVLNFFNVLSVIFTVESAVKFIAFGSCYIFFGVCSADHLRFTPTLQTSMCYSSTALDFNF
jgi:hypothetical protein